MPWTGSPGRSFQHRRFRLDAGRCTCAVPVDRRRTPGAEFIDALIANGGTEIRAAMALALRHPRQRATSARSCSSPTARSAPRRLFTPIEQRLGDARLFTIAIGSAPNSYFMRKAAQFGRGTYTHIGDIGDVSEKMAALFAKLERVALHRRRHRLAGSRRALSARDSRPLRRRAARSRRELSRDARPPLLATAFGRAAGAAWKQTVGGVPSELPGISTLWARRKIEYLIDSRVAGADEALIRKLVIETALEHHLVSPYTSLVAVDKTPARSAAAALERRKSRTQCRPAHSGRQRSPRRPRRGHCCAGSAPSR